MNENMAHAAFMDRSHSFSSIFFLSSIDEKESSAALVSIFIDRYTNEKKIEITNQRGHHSQTKQL